VRPYVVSHLNAKATRIDNGRRFTLPGESRNACRIASLLISFSVTLRGDSDRKATSGELHDDAFQCCSR